LKYLLDTNVLKELSRPTPHVNVEAWLSKVDDIDLAISVISVREISKGIEKKRASDEGLANRLAESANRIFSAYDDRIIAIDKSIAVVWGTHLGRSDKNVDDVGLAATAKVHNLVVVTRNEKDFAGREVTILNPFKSPAKLIPSL